MSNFQCKECGTTLIDLGKEGYKTAKEIQLEELLQRTANHYEGAVQQNKELQQELIEKNKQLEVFNVEYFKGLTYEAIAELAKTAIRITAENRELTHKIEDYVEEQCSNCEETSEHCEFCDIKDLKEIGGCNDTKN